MMRDEIFAAAKEAGMSFYGPRLELPDPHAGSVPVSADIGCLERFAALVAAREREMVASWMRARSFATGHGDTVDDLLNQIEWQVAEREREACAKICEGRTYRSIRPDMVQINRALLECAAAIRSRECSPTLKGN